MRKKFLRTFVAALLICSMLVTPAYAASGTVTGTDVNIRSGPGINYSVVACLPRNASITVTDSSNSSWYAVSYNGITGFMSSRYVSINDNSSDSTVVQGSDTNAYINAMYVRFRSGPSSSSTVLGEYNTGKEIIAVSDSNGWTECIINGKTGYVYSSYVTYKGQENYTPPAVEEDSSGEESSSPIVIIPNSPSSAPAATPAPTSTPAPAATPAPSSNPGGVVIIPDGSINTGKTEDKEEEKEPEAPAETPAPTPTPAATPTPTPAPTATPTPAATSAPSSNPGGVVIIPDSGSNTGKTEDKEEEKEPETPAETPAPTPVPTPELSPVPSGEQSGYINGDYVRFRTGPSTSYSIIATYNRGKELTVLGTSGEWTKCRISGKEGFVYSQYVSIDSGEEKEEEKEESKAPVVNTPSTDNSTNNNTVSTPSKPGFITGNNVRFRSGPNTSSDILGELFYGNNVTITGKNGDWTAITYNGKSGFVYSQYVKEGEYSYSSSGGSSELGREIADFALQFVGYNYSWGGKDPSTGFDCSGLMYYVYSQFGYTLNRVAADQARNGVHVEPDALQPGDILCFYSSGSYIGHVGMYIGDNKFVHAASSAIGVVVTDLSGYYSTRGFEARRII